MGTDGIVTPGEETKRERDIVLDIRGVHHWFGPKHVLHDVNIQIERGSITSLVGPSGCGKSTLLRAIVGTHPPRQGQVLVRSTLGAALKPVTQPGRDRGIVYQQYSLFPFWTALKNVAMGPAMDQTNLFDRAIGRFFWFAERYRAMRDEASELLDKVRLSDAKNQYPHQMSGGMRQRVAIAQALIMKPAILLLDEPFGALDEATREELQRLLLSLYMENLEARRRGLPPPYTIVIVTHELNEAIYVGDRVIGLSQYWNWKEMGASACLGATVVYDQPAPVFLPDDTRKHDIFAQQRADIRQSAFDPTYLQDREVFQSRWDNLHSSAI